MLYEASSLLVSSIDFSPQRDHEHYTPWWCCATGRFGGHCMGLRTMIGSGRRMPLERQ